MLISHNHVLMRYILGVCLLHVPLSLNALTTEDLVATVRFGDELSAQEKSYCGKRKEKVKNTLSTIFQKDVPYNAIPTIAIACSGGGYRAMLYAMGAIAGAEKNGTLDATTYLVGLSGSTWAIGGWLSGTKSARDYLNWLIPITTLGLGDLNLNDTLLMGHMFFSKYYYNQTIGLVDLYGGLLANNIFSEFGSSKFEVKLSSQQQRIDDASVPFPIYTAIRADLPTASSESMWYEFNPYEIGALWLSSYIPSWAYGREFKNGISVNFAPEESFSTLLATFGLAIGVTIAELAKDTHLEDKFYFSFAKKMVRDIINDGVGSIRPISALINNFTAEMEQSMVQKQEELELIDAGINCNLPYPPISGQRPDRKADIIVFIDASLGTIGDSLRCVEYYAQHHGLAFPTISYDGIGTHAVSVFKDESNPQAPVIIYVPRITDHALFTYFMNDPDYAPLIEQLAMFDIDQCINIGSCGTFNFKYTLADAQRVALLGELNMQFARSAIIDAIQWYMNRP